LQWIAAGSLVARLPPQSAATPIRSVSPHTSMGYGTDPDLKDPMVPWPLVMTAHQIQQTAVLADLILPGSAHSQAPSALRIPDFVNEWVSAPYPDQAQDRSVIFAGLEWIDEEAKRRGRPRFLDLDRRVQGQVVDGLAQKVPEPPFASQVQFLKRLRYLVVGAYYTTPEGFKEIGYMGNVPLASYPAVTDEERRILDSGLAKLGLLQV
jgi:hypothetical protein